MTVLNDKVLVEVATSEEVTETGIILTSAKAKRKYEGTVVGVGNHEDIKKIGVDVGELAKLISAVQDTADSLTPEDREAVAESVEVIDAEISGGKPKKSLLKTALMTLNTIKGTAEFGAAVAALVQFISQYI